MSENDSFTIMPIHCTQILLKNLDFSTNCTLKLWLFGWNVCGDAQEKCSIINYVFKQTLSAEVRKIEVKYLAFLGKQTEYGKEMFFKKSNMSNCDSC